MTGAEQRSFDNFAVGKVDPVPALTLSGIQA